jgi:DNA-binding NarL/FixJ family response regulator
LRLRCFTSAETKVWSMRQRVGVRIHSDDPVVRCGVAGLLRQQPDLAVLEDGDQPADAVHLLCVDAVNESALVAIHELGTTTTGRTVLVVGKIREAELRNALATGVAAVVRRREASPERVMSAIRAAHAHRAEPDKPMPEGLSKREIDVIRLVAQGMDTRAIATQLSYSERTIKKVLHEMMLRRNLRNRAHAVAYAAREGYLGETLERTYPGDIWPKRPDTSRVVLQG